MGEAKDLVQRLLTAAAVEGEVIDGELVAFRGMPPWADIFLASFSQTGVVMRACERARITRNVANEWRKHSPEFARRWAEAEEDAADLIELKARERAIINGSDQMLMFLLRAHRPQIYDRPRQSIVSGPDGGPIPVQHQITSAAARFVNRFFEPDEEEEPAEGAYTEVQPDATPAPLQLQQPGGFDPGS